eukprot:TRINITY_DN2500_c0_g1_i2.p1 TRINITY_DN2500_c0_g1~~TRINITY_DN2500_c0_g1_i2.p1  ORF type:complete len:290 (+),score=81.15 TRINITY_DN2500_c0_g1_i2:208-1077(+)
MKLAFFQGGVSSSVSINLSLLATQARNASLANADIIVFPELFLTGYYIADKLVENAETLQGSSSQFVSRVALENNIWIVYGYSEKCEDKYYNSAIVFNKRGELVLNYRKSHLYGDYERKYFTPGDDLPTLFDVEGVKVALLICWEIEVLEMARVVGLMGADLILVPTANTSSFVCDVTVRSRAFENQLFVCYVNKVGYENGMVFCGGSSLVASDGNFVTKAPLIPGHFAPSESEKKQEHHSETTTENPEKYFSLEIAEVNRKDPKLLETSKKNPFFEDRRLTLYKALVT